MSSARTFPKGSIFYTSPDGSTYTAVTDAKSIKAPGLKYGRSESTDLSSPSETCDPGWMAIGEFSIKLYFFATTLTTLLGLLPTTSEYFKVALPLIGSQSTASKFTWQGYIEEFDPAEIVAASNDKFMIDFKGVVQLGTFAFTAGS
jgi:hypothetical protein